VVTAADRGGDRTASAPRHLARVDGSGGTGGGQLAYTGTDAAAVLGVGLLALLLGTVLALASRRPGRTR
jgi:hypothetical protein